MGGEQLPSDPIPQAGKAAVGCLAAIFVAVGIALVAGVCWRIFVAVALGG